MLGWHIFIYSTKSGAVPRVIGDHGELLAEWRAAGHGLDWLPALIDQGDAVELVAGGYPTRYRVLALGMLPLIQDARHSARAGTYQARTERLGRCMSDEWFVVEVWDES